MSLSKPAPESESSSPLNRLTESIAETAEDVGNEVVDKLTDKLGVKDFYSAHVLTYCEGAYQPDPTDPNASKNVTHCSERKALYMFDPKDIMAKELVGGVSLEDLKWPDALDDGIRSLRAALKAMFIAYVVGIAVTGLTIITSAIGVADIGSLTAVINLVLCSVSPTGGGGWNWSNHTDERYFVHLVVLPGIVPSLHHRDRSIHQGRGGHHPAWREHRNRGDHRCAVPGVYLVRHDAHALGRLRLDLHLLKIKI